jgi:hypothetical protein
LNAIKYCMRASASIPFLVYYFDMNPISIVAYIQAAIYLLPRAPPKLSHGMVKQVSRNFEQGHE